jgi:hypothetical protein
MNKLYEALYINPKKGFSRKLNFMAENLEKAVLIAEKFHIQAGYYTHSVRLVTKKEIEKKMEEYNRKH